jgi:hypothetical protein
MDEMEEIYTLASRMASTRQNLEDKIINPIEDVNENGKIWNDIIGCSKFEEQQVKKHEQEEMCLMTMIPNPLMREGNLGIVNFIKISFLLTNFLIS